MKIKAKGIIIGLLLILILPVSLLAQTGEIIVTVTIENLVAALVVAPPAKTADPGETVTYNFTVQNISNVADSYNLSVDSSLRWKPTITSSSTVGPLAPQETASVTAQQTLPATELGGAQDTLTLTANSVADRRLSGSGSVSTSVNQTAAVSIDVTPNNINVRPGESVEFRATIRNEGNGNDSFRSTTSAPLGWIVEFPETDLVGPLAPAGRQTIPVRLTVPASAISGQRYRVDIIATSQFNLSTSNSNFATVRVR